MANVRKYLSTVKKIENPLEGIYTITFSSNKKFKFLPGQFLHLALDEYDGVGQWPESRCFSMQSSPSEEFLKITFAVKGVFTNRMANELRIGRNVWLKLPYGDIFQRGHDLIDCIFIAGGTGITPFLSLFTDYSFSAYKNPVLYVGFRNSDYHIFRNELEKARKINEEFSINIIFQDEHGMLDIEKIYNNHGDKVYFISGPPQMIKNFKNYLLQKGVNDYRIIADDWE